MHSPRYISYRRQKGSGDSFAIIGIIILCCVISVALMLLNWVKTTKDARLQREIESQAPKGNIKRQPNGYQVVY